jgi:Spy/CpxP family protein refolding chaperone
VFVDISRHSGLFSPSDSWRTLPPARACSGEGDIVKKESHSLMSSPKRRSQWLWAVLFLAMLGYGARFVWRAHRNLVTLDVREMDVRKVVKKMEWQTWENIHVHKEVQGKITLKVINTPLEEVLRIVSAQSQSRPALFYALYSDGKSLSRLNQSLRGEVDPAMHGWTNLANRPFGGGGGGPGGFGGGGMFGFTAPGAPGQSVAGDGHVSLNLQAQTVDFATLAFSRFAQTRVVPEDGVTTIVNLTLSKIAVPDAVAKLAKAAKRKWVAVYALQGGFGFSPGGDRTRGPRGSEDGGGTNRFPFPGFGGPDLTDAQREEMRAEREAQELALRNALPTDARQKYELAQQEREAAMRDLQNATPEQIRDRFSAQNSAAINQMMRDRVMNSTPEQRAQMGQRRGGGPGGPGGGRGPGGGGPGGGAR